MSKVEVDLEALAVAVSNAILGFAKPDEGSKKKRGRPPKIKPMKKEKKEALEKAGWVVGDAEDFLELNEDEIKAVEEEIKKSEAPPPIPKKSAIAPAKAPGREVVGAAAKTTAFQITNRPNKFFDNGTLAAGDKVPAHKYPEPSDRRPAVQKMRFNCSVCGKPWDDFPSNVPQAFARLGDGKEAATPIVRCEDCIAAIVTSRQYANIG